MPPAKRKRHSDPPIPDEPPAKRKHHSPVEEWLEGIPAPFPVARSCKSDTCLLDSKMQADPNIWSKRPAPPSPSESRNSAGVSSRSDAASIAASSQTPFSDSQTRQKNHSSRDPDYRATLHYHGIRIDDLGDELPTKVEELVQKITAASTTNLLGQDQIRLIRAQLSKHAGSDEESTRIALIKLPLFPSSDEYQIQTAAGLRFNRAAIPTHDTRLQNVRTPKPDLQFGYAFKSFNTDHCAAMQHRCISSVCKPSTGPYWPFFVVELKSPSRGGTHWVAENQNAVTGAHCVNARKLVLDHAGFKDTDPLHCIAFSCVADVNLATIWIHWLDDSKGKPRFVGSLIGSYVLKMPRDLQSFARVTRNIVEYGMNEQLPAIWQLLNRCPT